MAWIQNGPVSLPPQSAVSVAGTIVAVLAVAGAGMGFRAAWRDGGRPGLASGDQALAVDGAITAKPIVEIPSMIQQPAAANTAQAAAADDSSDNGDDSNAIAAKTAAAQAAQSRTARPPANIDDMMTSPSEKPQTPAKSATDESPPGAPVKSDVPF